MRDDFGRAEGEDSCLGGAANAQVQATVADAASHEERDILVRAEPHGKVAWKVGQSDQSAEAGQTDLSAVGMASHDEAGAVCSEPEGDVGAMGQDDGGDARGDDSESAVQVVAFSGGVVDADDGQSAVVEDVCLIGQDSDACRGEGCAETGHIILATRAAKRDVVMIPEDGESRLSSWNQSEKAGDAGDIVVDVDEVAGVEQQVMRRRRHDFGELPGEVGTGMDVEVAQVEDAQSIKTCRADCGRRESGA